ncbi:hypothetical protein ACFSTC_35930 [Nonomuraea ferruginea]
MSVLAIDAGTTGVTALVVTEDGRIESRGGVRGVRPALPAAGLGGAQPRGHLAGHAERLRRRPGRGVDDAGLRRHHQPA